MATEGILNFEQALELLDDKIVTTTGGKYIAVQDLIELDKQFKEAKKGEQERMASAKSFAGASRLAALDPAVVGDLAKPKIPTPPADAGVVKPVAARSEQ